MQILKIQIKVDKNVDDWGAVGGKESINPHELGREKED